MSSACATLPVKSVLDGLGIDSRFSQARLASYESMSGLMTGINRFKAEPVMSMGRPVG